jgi:hypothetical protein
LYGCVDDIDCFALWVVDESRSRSWPWSLSRCSWRSWCWGGVEEAAPEGPQPNVDMAVILAEMQAMRAEMNAMHQAGAGAAVGAAPTCRDAPISVNGEGGGVVQPRGAPQQYLDL